MPDQPAHTVIPFACPRCGRGGRAATHLAGREVACPHCDGRVTVPPPLAAPDDTQRFDPQADTHRVEQQPRRPEPTPPPAAPPPPPEPPAPHRWWRRALRDDLDRRLSDWIWAAAVTLLLLVLLAAVAARLLDR
jgi:DNA-directed RNA polymerase subunit RPC12/RpoP